MKTNGAPSSCGSAIKVAGRRSSIGADVRCHSGDRSSGIGLAWKSFRHWLAVQRAQVLDFFRRALSVEIPVPAYIWRYSLDRKMKPSLARRVGVHSDLSQIARQL